MQDRKPEYLVAEKYS